MFLWMSDNSFHDLMALAPTTSFPMFNVDSSMRALGHNSALLLCSCEHRCFLNGLIFFLLKLFSAHLVDHLVQEPHAILMRANWFLFIGMLGKNYSFVHLKGRFFNKIHFLLQPNDSLEAFCLLGTIWRKQNHTSQRESLELFSQQRLLIAAIAIMLPQLKPLVAGSLVVKFPLLSSSVLLKNHRTHSSLLSLENNRALDHAH